MYGLRQSNVTMCPFRQVAKIIHNESFKDNICPIWMLCAVVWFRRVNFQKQPPEVFLKKVVLKNSAKFTGKHMCWMLF